MTNQTTAFKTDCRVLRMKHEYPGYTGDIAWIIVSDLTTEQITERYPEEKFLIVYAAFGDKHAPECLKFLEKIADEFIFTIPGVDGRAAYSPEELTGFTGKTAVIENDPVLAVKRAVAQNRRRVIISGSLYLAGTALQLLLDPEEVLDI